MSERLLIKLYCKQSQHNNRKTNHFKARGFQVKKNKYSIKVAWWFWRYCLLLGKFHYFLNQSILVKDPFQTLVILLHSAFRNSFWAFFHKKTQRSHRKALYSVLQNFSRADQAAPLPAVNAVNTSHSCLTILSDRRRYGKMTPRWEGELQWHLWWGGELRWHLRWGG